MNRKEFENVKIGDVVIITHYGINCGKRGIVMTTNLDGWRGIFIEPLDCKFEFATNSERRRHTTNDGRYYRWPYTNLKIESKSPTNKEFYIARMFGEDGISWSTKNFTEKELEVIGRFLEEFNEHGSGLSIDCIAILEQDEDEE